MLNVVQDDKHSLKIHFFIIVRIDSDAGRPNFSNESINSTENEIEPAIITKYIIYERKCI